MVLVCYAYDRLRPALRVLTTSAFGFGGRSGRKLPFPTPDKSP